MGRSICRKGWQLGSPRRHDAPATACDSIHRKDGLVIVTTDQAPATGEYADSSACCGQPTFPNVPASVGVGGLVRGGGQVGALLLSPFVKGGALAQNPYNTFSLLRTIEDLFGLAHLGYAALPEVSSFAPALFTAVASRS